MVITKKLKLYPPNKQKLKLLEKTALSQSKCVNFWIDKIKKLGNTDIKELQRKFYYEAKNKFNLGAISIQLAKHIAIIMVRTSNKKQTDFPYLKQKIIITSRILLEENNIGFAFGNTGRFWIPFHSQTIPKGKLKESKLKVINNEWYCFLTIDIDEPKVKKYKRILGIDLGLAKIATATDNKGKNTLFFRGEESKYKRHKYYEMRKKLQPLIKKGNVYKLLKKISKKESNWMTDTNHKISREIINLGRNKKMEIAVENLTGITERLKFNKKTRRMLKGWSFRQLQDFIKYKAQLAGLPYVTVDPRETSKKCSKCGYVSRSNRKSQERFKCNKCGYETNADRNGAINIAKRATGLSVYPIV